MRRSLDEPAPRSPAPSPAQYRAHAWPHAAARERLNATGLLPQPGGFEGLLLRPVLAAPCDLPIADCVDGGESQVSLDSAELRTTADPRHGDDLVFACLDQFDGLAPEIVEGADPVLHVDAQRVLAVNRAVVIECTLNRPVVDVVRQVLQPCIQVPTVKGRSRFAHDLHVLLRHCPAQYLASQHDSRGFAKYIVPTPSIPQPIDGAGRLRG